MHDTPKKPTRLPTTPALLRRSAVAGLAAGVLAACGGNPPDQVPPQIPPEEPSYPEAVGAEDAEGVDPATTGGEAEPAPAEEAQPPMIPPPQ
jgi:hypothetical protein